MSSLSFPVPEWLCRAGRAARRRGPRGWAAGALLAVEQLQQREGSNVPTYAGLREGTKPDIKGYGERAALVNPPFHDFFLFVMTPS